MRRVVRFLLREVLFNKVLKRRGKRAFFSSLPPRSRVLDVGCGSTSPRFFKALRPDCHYVGVDIDCGHAHSPNRTQEFIYTAPEHFASTIQSLKDQFDAVVSSHNIEHCNTPREVIAGMLKCIKPGGRLYISFPCEESITFPRRKGTLNFFDDATHSQVPDWNLIVSAIKEEGYAVEFIAKRYRPPILAFIGLLIEPVLALVGKAHPATTWSLYGFESIIWASRPKSER